MTTITQQIKEYMYQCIEAGDCTDSAGVIIPTQLAESACDEFEGWDEDDKIAEIFFELAADVAEEVDQWNAIKGIVA